MALVEENDMKISEEQAKEYCDRLHATGELADEELDTGSGGCGSKSGPAATPAPEPVVCGVCGRQNVRVDVYDGCLITGEPIIYKHYSCNDCRYWWKEIIMK